MRKRGKKKLIIYLGFLVAVIIIGILGINTRYEINNYGVKKVAKKAGANATTGTGAMGSTTNYGKVLGQLKSNAKAEVKKIVLLDLYDGYYTQIKIDTTSLYKEGVTQGMVGNAGKGDVLVGKTFTNSTKIGETGTMPNNGAKNASLNPGGSYTIPAGYHNGKGVITANKMTGTYTATTKANNINMGETNTYRYVNTNGVPNYSSATYKPTTSGLLDMKVDNNYRYIDTSAVYNSGYSNAQNTMTLSWLSSGRAELRLPYEYSKISVIGAEGAKIRIYSKDGTLLATSNPSGQGTIYRTIQ